MAIDDMKGNVTKGRVTMTGRMDDKPTTINAPNLSGMNKLFTKRCRKALCHMPFCWYI